MIFQIDENIRVEPDYCSWAISRYYPVTAKRKKAVWEKEKWYASLKQVQEYLIDNALRESTELQEAIKEMDRVTQALNEKLARRADDGVWGR